MRPTQTEGELLKLVFAAFFLGLISGVVYGVFELIRILRRGEKTARKNTVAQWTDRVLCFFEDVGFFMILCLLNVILFSSYGAGKVRIECFFIQLAGFLLWYHTLGRVLCRICVKAKKEIIKVTKAVYKKTLLPVRERAYEKRRKRRMRNLERRLEKYTVGEIKRLRRSFGIEELKKEQRVKGYEKQK